MGVLGQGGGSCQRVSHRNGRVLGLAIPKEGGGSPIVPCWHECKCRRTCQQIPGRASRTCVKLMQASSTSGTARSTSLTVRALQRLHMLTAQCCHSKCHSTCATIGKKLASCLPRCDLWACQPYFKVIVQATGSATSSSTSVAVQTSKSFKHAATCTCLHRGLAQNHRDELAAIQTTFKKFAWAKHTCGEILPQKGSLYYVVFDSSRYFHDCVLYREVLTNS